MVRFGNVIADGGGFMLTALKSRRTKLKQSNGNLTALLAKMAREAREEGAAQEREKYAKVIKSVAKMLLDGVERLTILTQIQDEGLTGSEKPQPKKRKAVVATVDDVNCIRDVFYACATGTILKPNAIKGTGIGHRTIAAACQSLVLTAFLEKVGTKGYRLAQRKENGLDETVPTRTPAE